MKKKLQSLIAVSSVLLCAISHAQPTITATGTNPVIGNSFTYTTTSYFAPGSSGASQTWDFSSITGTPGGSSTCVSVGSTPNGSSFPNANIAFSNSGSNYSYSKTSTTAYQNYGYVSSGGVVMPYSNPEDFLHFPFTFNNTYTDPWAVNFVNGGYTFYRTGTTAITADAYGTLTTPAGTFTNVLRVHMVQTYQDSADMGGPYLIQYSNDEYLWYANGTNASLAACFTIIAAGSTSQSGFYLGTPVGVNDINQYLSSFDLYPSPALNNITIDINLTENKKAEVKLFNSLGQQVLNGISEEAIQGSNTMSFDITTLPDGIYFAQILLEGNIGATKRFIVAK